MYGTTCPYLPFGCQPSRQCVVSMRRTSRLFLTYTAPPTRRGRRIHAVRELWQGDRPARTKMPLCWQNAREMRPRAAIRGKFCAPCIPKVASDGKIASSWQDSRAMHPKRAGFGRICAPCIRKALQTAVWEYTVRRSCHEGPAFAARTPRIMHGAQILPFLGARVSRTVPVCAGWRGCFVGSLTCSFELLPAHAQDAPVVAPAFA